MYFCRECSCFVSNPYATCTHCGHDHDQHHGLALEEPIRKRRPSARVIPVRGYRR